MGEAQTPPQTARPGTQASLHHTAQHGHLSQTGSRSWGRCLEGTTLRSLQLSCVGGQGGGRAEAICASTKEMNSRNQTERAGQGSWTTSRADKRQPRASRLTEPRLPTGACPA